MRKCFLAQCLGDTEEEVPDTHVIQARMTCYAGLGRQSGDSVAGFANSVCFVLYTLTCSLPDFNYKAVALCMQQCQALLG